MLFALVIMRQAGQARFASARASGVIRAIVVGQESAAERRRLRVLFFPRR